MTLNKVVLFDPEPAYRRRFLSYARNRREFPFEWEGAESAEACLRLCRKGETAALLVPGEVWRGMEEGQRREIRGRAALCCLLCDGPGTALPGAGQTAEDGTSLPVLDRCQPVPRILEALLAELESAGVAGTRQEEKARCIGVYAPLGSSGRTASAMHCAIRRAEEARTVFVSFSPFPGFSASSGDDAPAGLSEILYAMKYTGSPSAGMAQPEFTGNLRLIAPAASPEDIWELTPEGMADVLEDILRHGGGEVCVAEIPEGGSPLPVFRLCDEILLVRDETEDGRRGIAAFRAWLRQKGEEVLLARCREMTAVPAPELAGMSVGDPLFRYSLSASRQMLPEGR